MSAFACRRCTERVKDWNGDDPKCGFDAEGNFLAHNWNCATLGGLRDLAEADGAVRLWHNDSNMAILPGPEEAQMLDGAQEAGYPHGRGSCFVVIKWYKHRGRTESVLWWSSMDVPRLITLVEAEMVLDKVGQR